MRCRFWRFESGFKTFGVEENPKGRVSRPALDAGSEAEGGAGVVGGDGADVEQGAVAGDGEADVEVGGEGGGDVEGVCVFS